ncbi:hypothetical protein RGQ29_011324 [Quercus rubra]|uniref:Uncharacterized protein n=1 Tax=Quercus rubra TaxID=3512 RepID=A0AAN7J8N7_QUERU|nr:hypothetical protein RGQ29_011324 [Quercus rubra]
MKATLIVCLLLASTFFIPSSDAASSRVDKPRVPIGRCDPKGPYGRGCITKPPSPSLKPPPTSPFKPPTPPSKPPPSVRNRPVIP